MPAGPILASSQSIFAPYFSFVRPQPSHTAPL